MTYDTSYSFTGTEVPDDTYEKKEVYVDDSPKIRELGKIKLKKRPAKMTEQEERDRRRAWLRNLREE